MHLSVRVDSKHADLAAGRAGFSLVEMLIVISVLGIMAAIVVPILQDHSQKAKEAQSKVNLQRLRTAIERYKIDHNGVCPGYIDGVAIADFLIGGQLTCYTARNGDYASTKTGSYIWGPYLSEMPSNPFNRESTLTLVDDGFPSEASEETGWYYKPSTGEIRLNKGGLDSAETPFFEY